MRRERLARVASPIVAGALMGLAAGGIWTLAQPDRYRAEARVLVRGTSVVGLPALETLAGSSLLEQNVAQTLHLGHPPHVDVEAGKGGVVTLTVEAGNRERARQIDAEAALLFTQLVSARFEAAGRVFATQLDPAHVTEQTSPTPGRNLLISTLIGLAVGLGTAVALARRRPIPLVEAMADPNVERRLRARIDEVAKRERALARRAGELAKRDAELRERERRIVERERAGVVAPVAVQPEAPPAQSEPEPTPEPEPEPDVVTLHAAGSANLDELETLVRDRAASEPDRYEEWMTYIYYLREHASADGTLPRSFDGLLNEVFGGLVSRGA